MAKTRKKSKKTYALDRYEKYSIHKVTLISYDPVKSCKAIQQLFGPSNVSQIHSPPDPALKKRGIKWVRLLSGGKAEFHFVPPVHLKYDKIIRQIIKAENEQSPVNFSFYENHVGIYVPDLTPVCNAATRLNIPHFLGHRSDGMYQFYVNIPECIDYLDIDSLKYDESKGKCVPMTFVDFAKKAGKISKKFEKNTAKRHSKTIKNKKHHLASGIFMDNKHKEPRMIDVSGDKLIIKGKDGPSKPAWRVEGKFLDNNHIIIDFSKKGGPKDIKATVEKAGIRFSDGNLWKREFNHLPHNYTE